MARTYARSGGKGTGEGELALENVKPTDSPIYRPPSEFAVRAFRKTFTALGIGTERDERERGNRTETARARRRGVFRFLRTRARSDALAFLSSSSLFLFARGAFRRRVPSADG